jgi:hypothetical protein
MNRGDRREAVFEDDQDQERFLQTLAEACQKALWQVHAYCLPKDSVAGRRVFAQCMERRRREDSEDSRKEFKRVERGWCLGGEEFRRELLEQVSQGSGASHYGEAVQEAVEVRAERLVSERLKAMGWTDKDLAVRRKGDPKKVKLAAKLRAETTVPLAWIAQRLAMGSRGYLTWLLYRQGRVA